jgi:hypothetical protein
MTPGAIELIALCVVIVAAFIGLIWAYENWPRRVVIDEHPHGDATETPQMMQQTRRVNHERRKV